MRPQQDSNLRSRLRRRFPPVPVSCGFASSRRRWPVRGPWRTA